MHRCCISICLAVALLISWSPGALAESAKTIRLTNGEWQPYLSKDVPHHGFASHVVTEAFAQVAQRQSDQPTHFRSLLCQHPSRRFS